MKTIRYQITAMLMLSLASTAFAQIDEMRELASFNKIEVRENAKVYVTIGTPQSVKVQIKEGDLKEVETAVENSTLKIGGEPSRVYITMPELTSVTVSGYGDVRVDSTTVKTGTLRLDISGNGKITMPVEADKIEAGISGLGKINLSGSASSLDLDISGSGKLNAHELKVNRVDASISGVGKCYADVISELNLNISGTGAFYFRQEPPKINSHVSGIGKYGSFENNGGGDSATVHMGNKKIIIVDDDGEAEENNEHERFDFDFDFDHHHDDDTIPKEPEKSRSHWTGVDLGFNQLFAGNKFNGNMPEGYDFLELNSGKSVNVNINIYGHDFKIYREYVMLTTGIGLTLNNYRFDSDKTLLADSNRVAADYDLGKDGNPISYQKNKLAVNYVTVPLLLQFNTSEYLKKSIHFAVGMLFSYKYNSHLKLVFKEEGDKEKTKRQDEFNIEPLRYDVTARIGYKNFTLYASYALSDFFKDNRGPELHPFQVGINLFNW